MLDTVRQQIDKCIRDAGGVPLGLIDGPQRVVIFDYRGLDMAMYANDITYANVRRHMEEKASTYAFPRCLSGCGAELPAGRSGDCTLCLLGARKSNAL